MACHPQPKITKISAFGVTYAAEVLNVASEVT